MDKIYGSIIDNAGRCIHYDSTDDIVANKCYCCKKYYACYHCHNEQEDHFFLAWPISKEPLAKIILCGKCGVELNYAEYKLNECLSCGHLFNKKCVLHHQIYFS